MSEDYPPDGFGQDAIGRAFTDAAEHERLKQTVLAAALAWDECSSSDAVFTLIEAIRAYRAAKEGT